MHRLVFLQERAEIRAWPEDRNALALNEFIKLISCRVAGPSSTNLRVPFMACVNPDGTITESAKRMLEALKEPLAPDEISMASGQPLFKIRSSLREMVESGLVTEDGEKYKTTDAGLAKLKRQ